jgi:hypothetical protein
MATLELTIGRYRVERACARRPGEGQAFIALDGERGERVVLQFVEVTPGQSAGAVLARLKREVDASAELDDPGLLRVRSNGLDEQRGPYLVREYVVGPSLKALPRMDVDLHAALRMLVQVAHALTLADQAGVAPRTLTLDHVHVAATGQVRLEVFGHEHAAPPSSAASAYQLARAGLELLVGREAFEEAAGGVGSPRLPATLDKGLATAFGKALSPGSDERFPTPAAFMQVLIAEAPLPESQQQDLLDLMDQQTPLRDDPVVQAWARSIWRDQAAFDAAAAAPPVEAGPTAVQLPAGVEPPRIGAAAASAVAAPRRGRAGLVVGVVGAALALAVAGSALLGGQRSVVLRLDSSPSGALVNLDGRPLGLTPLEVQDPAPGARATLSREGYQPAEITLRTGEATRLVTLLPLTPTPPPAAEAAPGPAEAPTPPPAEPVAAPAARPEPEAAAKVEPPRAKPKAKAKEAKPAAPKDPPRPPAEKDKKSFDLFKHLEEQSKG